MRRIAVAAVIVALALAACGPARAAERVFLRAGVGGSVPFLKNLSNEMSIQGTDEPRPGYSFGVSLGRTLYEQRWSLEVHFSAAFYPNFDFTSATDSFPGRLQHYDYGLILRRSLLSEERRLQASLGAGLGYGVTNLISGGGKFDAFEAIVAGRVETRIQENINVSLEGIYYAGLQKKKYNEPFLASYDTDVVKDHLGNPLEDRFNSFDLRLGITVFLKQRMQE